VVGTALAAADHLAILSHPLAKARVFRLGYSVDATVIEATAVVMITIAMTTVVIVMVAVAVGMVAMITAITATTMIHIIQNITTLLPS
jgi:hypothetical protein